MFQSVATSTPPPPQLRARRASPVAARLPSGLGPTLWCRLGLGAAFRLFGRFGAPFRFPAGLRAAFRGRLRFHPALRLLTAPFLRRTGLRVEPRWVRVGARPLTTCFGARLRLRVRSVARAAPRLRLPRLARPIIPLPDDAPAGITRHRDGPLAADIVTATGTHLLTAPTDPFLPTGARGDPGHVVAPTGVVDEDVARLGPAGPDHHHPAAIRPRPAQTGSWR